MNEPDRSRIGTNLEELPTTPEASKDLLDPENIRRFASSVRRWSAEDSGISKEAATRLALYGGIALMTESIATHVFEGTGFLDPATAKNARQLIVPVSLANLFLIADAFDLEGIKKEPNLKNSTLVVPWLAGRMERLASAIEKAKLKP